jgi:Domain of unknown function (DU1801)
VYHCWKGRGLDEAAIYEFLSSYSGKVQDLTLRVRDVVLEALPEAIERIYPTLHIIGYGRLRPDGNWGGEPPIYIAPFKEWVNLGFSWGVNLPNPDHLLIGRGLRVRHVKVARVGDVDPDKMGRLLEAAWVI